MECDFGGRSRRTAALKDPHEDSIRFRPHSKRHGRHALSAGAATTGQRRLHLRGFSNWITENRAALKEQLKDHGAILFRNFPIQQPEDFEALIEAGHFEAMPYVGGAAPRDKVTAKRVLTSNNSPSSEPIPFHHEMAQVPNPPAYIFFYCDIPSQQGGETAILFSPRIYQRFRDVDVDFANHVETHGVRYIRIMPSEDDPTSAIGRSWKSTF